MLQKFQRAVTVATLLAGAAAGVSCGKTSNHYLYATVPAVNQVAVFREDPYSGVLTQLSTSPYSVGSGAISVVIHPSGKYLYVANPGQEENDISLFDINSDGTITEVTPRSTVGSDPSILAMDPGGAYLYVADIASNDIWVFSIDSSTGKLTNVPGFSPLQTNLTPTSMVLSPKGDYLFISGPSQPNYGLIAGYSVNAGQLTRVSLTQTADNNPAGMAIDPSGSFLYAANSTAAASSISVYGIAAGVLSPVSGSPLADTGKNPVALLVDSAGSYLYVANQGSNNITSYSISSTGFPVAVTDSPFATLTQPSFLTLDPSGKYLYVGNVGTSAGIEAFGVSSGSLNAIHTYGTGNTPSSIAVSK